MFKKILKYLSVIILIIAAAYLSIFGYFYYENLPKKLTSFDGISLSMHSDDLLFYKGEPIQKSKNNESMNMWSYAYEEFALFFSMNKGSKIIGIGILGTKCKYSCPSINRVKFGSSYQNVIDLLGKPQKIKKSENKLNWSLYYYKFNMKIGLEKNKVELIQIQEFDIE